MTTETQAELARRFRAMHHENRPLVLPNAWDVASARLVERAGFGAVATTSAGVAWALGYPDGQRVTRDEMLAVVAAIARHVRVPVTADLEAGYGLRPEDAAATARGAIEAGAVGFNFEDATDDPAHPLLDVNAQVERIMAARQAAQDAGVPLVINARTDVFLRSVGAPGSRLGETVRRLAAYRDAGADCLFAPGVADRETIGTLVRELNAPLNVLVRPETPPIAELVRLGVARVSLGPAVMRVALGAVEKLLTDLRAHGTFDTLLAGAIPFAELQELLGGA
jgi:2-methylisocitrate lyase-like PEP mutase family enzyme